MPEIDNSTKKAAKLTDAVNVRKTPSTDADIVGILKKGTEIEVLEQMNNGWTKINHPNGPAYVKSDYVKIIGEVEEETKEETTTAVTTKKAKLTDTVNVRKNSSTSADIIGILNKGSEIEVIEQMSNGWTKIKHPNGTAYVKSDFVEMQ